MVDQKTVLKKKRNKGKVEPRARDWIPFYVRYVHNFSRACLHLHVIHSILFFHLILFHFSLSSPSVIPASPSPFSWMVKRGFLSLAMNVDYAIVSHSAHSANHQYTYYDCVYTQYIDRFEWGSILCSSVSWHNAENSLSLSVSSVLAVFFCAKAKSMPKKMNQTEAQTQDTVVCVCECLLMLGHYWCR